jgi:hypothetical protein
MRRRGWISIVIGVAVLAALALALFLRAKAPPEAARLLPESDGIFYINLKPLRAATHFDQTPVQRSPDFQHFIDGTGIVPERDLDAVAFALHQMPNPNGPNGPLAYSEVFVGRFDGIRLNRYLASIAGSKETYAGRTVYIIPVDGRQLRIAQLNFDMVGASNMPTPEQIHSMLDRSRASALGTSGSSLLNTHFRDVPMLSEAWGIGHIGLPFSQDGHIAVLGLELPVSPDSDLVASVRWSSKVPLRGGSADLRIEQFAANQDDAEHTVQALNALTAIMRGIADAQPTRTPAQAAVRQVLDSVTLQQRDTHAFLHASASIEELKALTAERESTSPTGIVGPLGSDSTTGAAIPATPARSSASKQ